MENVSLGDMVFPIAQDRYDGWGLTIDMKSAADLWGPRKEGKKPTSSIWAGSFSPGDLGIVVDLKEGFARIVTTSDSVGWIPTHALVTNP